MSHTKKAKLGQVDRYQRAVGRHFVGLEAKDESKWAGPWGFVQMADTQLGMLKFDSWDEERAMVRTVVENINKLDPPPRFVCLCGDLINAYPEGQEKRGDWTKAEGMNAADAVNALRSPMSDAPAADLKE
jgi:hypothetical protein